MRRGPVVESGQMHVFQRAPRQRFGHGWKEGRRHALAFEMLGQVELELGGSLGHAVGELAAFVPFVRHLRSEMRMHAPVVCAQVGAEPMDARTVVCRAQLAQPGEDRRLRRDRAERSLSRSPSAFRSLNVTDRQTRGQSRRSMPSSRSRRRAADRRPALSSASTERVRRHARQDDPLTSGAQAQAEEPLILLAECRPVGQPDRAELLGRQRLRRAAAESGAGSAALAEAVAKLTKEPLR